jgi:tetratricopeptide (TPR) repeat protein
VFSDRAINAKLSKLQSSATTEDPAVNNPPPTQTEFDRALGFLRAGEMETAADICREQLGKKPKDDKLRTLYGMVLVRQNKFAEAESELRDVLSRWPRVAKANRELAHALIAQGQNTEAIACYKRVVELRPEQADAYRDLSMAYKTLGRMNEAYEALEASARLDPGRDQLMPAFEHLRAGDYGNAKTVCLEVLRKDPGNYHATRLLGMLAAELGEHKLTVQMLRNTVKLEPRFFGAYVDLARELMEADELEECLEVVQTAIKLQPELALPHALLGYLHNRAGRFEEAAEVFKTALAKQADHGASLAGLGHSLKTIGRQDDAVETYRNCIEAFPGFGDAYWALANLKTYRFSDDEITAMEEKVDNESLDDEARANFNYSLGKAYEDRGDYDRAFKRYERGAKLRLSNENPDPVHPETAHDEIIKTITPEVLQQNKDYGDPDPAPIFIVGLPRSGSTLIEQILASHSQVDGTHELPDLPRIIQAVDRQQPNGVGYPQALLHYGEELVTLGRQYIATTRRYRGDAPFFTDKMPGNFASVGLIALILPNAKVINARRYPLDSCMSCYKQLFYRGQTFTYDLVELGKYYLEYQRMMDYWHEILPGKVLDVQYEQMVADQENQTRRLLEHCGLPWEDNCLRFYETDRAVVTASSEQVRQPIYSMSVNSWRRFEKHLGPLIEVLEPLL